MSISRIAARLGTEGERRRDLSEILGLTAAILGLLILGFPAISGYPLWLDEAHTRAAVDTLGMSLTETPGQMPGYYIFMAAWGTVSIQPWWLRMPSLLFGIASLILIQRLGRLIGGSRLAAIAPLTLLTVPMFMTKAVEARSYQMEIFLVIASMMLFLEMSRAARSSDGRRVRRLSIWLLIIALTGPLMHGLFIIYFAVSLVTVVGLSGRSPHMPKAVLPPIVVASVITLGLLAVSGDQASGVLLVDDLPRRLQHEFLSPQPFIAAVLGVLAVVGAVASGARQPRSGGRRSLIPTFWVLLALIGMTVVRFGADRFEIRYLAPAAPFVALLVAQGLITVLQELKRVRWLQAAVAGRMSAPVLAIVLVFVAQTGFVVAPEQVERWDHAARTIIEGVRPADGIAIDYLPGGPLQFRVPFEAEWSLHEDRPELPLVSHERPLGRVQRYDTELTESQAWQRMRDLDRIWFVDYDRSADLSTIRGPAFERWFTCERPRTFEGLVVIQLCVADSGGG